MDYFRAKINHFVIDYPEVKKTIVRSFISKPTRTLEKKFGRLFGLIEIDNPDPKIPELIDLITEELKTRYYSLTTNAQEIEEYDLENNFENTLQKINLTIASFLESEKANLDLEKTSIVLGVIVQRQIIFSQIGKINIFLLQNLKKNDYRIIDILEASHTPVASPNPLKIFSQVITGRINQKDIVLIATNNVFDYFSLEKIKNIVTSTQATNEGISALRQVLEKTSRRQNFGVLIAEIEKNIIGEPDQAVTKEFNYRQAASKDSMRELIKTEEETEKLLAPSLLPEAKKYLKILNTAFQNYLAKVRDSQQRLSKKMISLPKFKIPKNLSQNIPLPRLPKIQSLTQPIRERTKTTFELLKKQSLTQKTWPPLKLMINSGWNKFNRLSRSSKITLVISVVLVLILSQSIIGMQIKNRGEKDLVLFNQAVETAETKKNESEASLIYRDENKAKVLLLEAKAAVLGLKPKNSDQQNRLAALNQDIDAQLEKLRHWVEIAEPVQVINFQNLDGQAKIANLALIWQDVIYTQNTRNQTIYKANVTSRVIAGIFSDNANTGNFTGGTVGSNNELLFINNEQKIFSFSLANDTIKEVSIAIKEGSKISDLVIYANRLYLLDQTNGQIYRYNKNDNSYGQVTDWLEDDTADLKNAVSLTIDGFLWVLKNNGEILKLEKGKKVDFTPPLVEPALMAPTKIKTSEGSDYLYILDPASQRLVVISKAGKLISQYHSANFKDLKDFAVVESQKKIYILDGRVIYGIAASHLP